LKVTRQYTCIQWKTGPDISEPLVPDISIAIEPILVRAIVEADG